jgi:hypothetical protein
VIVRHLKLRRDLGAGDGFDPLVLVEIHQHAQAEIAEASELHERNDASSKQVDIADTASGGGGRHLR